MKIIKDIPTAISIDGKYCRTKKENPCRWVSADELFTDRYCILFNYPLYQDRDTGKCSGSGLKRCPECLKAFGGG